MDLWQHVGLKGRRALIVHHDDLGLTRAQNQAYIALGFPSGAVMVPGSWATGLEGADLGIHLTLTSEWDAHRLRPLTKGHSLCDREGYFWKTEREAWLHIDPKEALVEMRAQVEKALAWGLDVTHLDSHMGVLVYPGLAGIYHQLALEYRLPILLPQNLDELLSPQSIFLKALKPSLEASPLPKIQVIDGYTVPAGERRDWYLKALSELGPGVYHLIHHAAFPTREGQGLADWEGRKADLEALQDPLVLRALNEFILLTYRKVRDALRTYL